uniref:Uncharacterized protein n=1 Tax=Nelumbo nucifera TaxID=4432 RepID=A0A822ZDB3_NELNU|nr:TPA_asm: hypothetical protein HUJ06_002424 [Nelumbo nucifera]
MCHVKWVILPKGGRRHQFLSHHRGTRIVQAVAVPVQPPTVDSAEQRKHLAESYGFTQIGEPLPENVTLKEIIGTLPKKVSFLNGVIKARHI